MTGMSSLLRQINLPEVTVSGVYSAMMLDCWITSDTSSCSCEHTLLGQSQNVCWLSD